MATIYTILCREGYYCNTSYPPFVKDKRSGTKFRSLDRVNKEMARLNRMNIPCKLVKIPSSKDPRHYGRSGQLIIMSEDENKLLGGYTDGTLPKFKELQ